MSLKSLEVTKIVRKIMRDSGKSMIWTNKYKNGVRTVKCYTSNESDANLQWNIRTVLNILGARFSISKTEPVRDWHSRGALIVRIPTQD